MLKVRKYLVAAISAVLVLTAFGASSTAAGVAKPLNVRITTFDGNPRLKATRKLMVVSSCNKDCRARMRVTLVMPAGRDSANISRTLKQGKGWFVTYQLTNLGLRYLRANLNRSRLTVTVTARDLETGKMTVKTRNFRFRR